MMTTVGGRRRGMTITHRDHQHLEWIARWYSLTDEHLGRMDKGWAAWAVMMSNDRLPKGAPLNPMPDGSKGQKASTYLSNLRTRMSRLSKVEIPGFKEGLVTRLRSWEPGRVTTGWWLTRTGKEYMHAPYSIATEPSVLKAGHVWDSADIGFQIESLFGLTILSERETTSGQTFRDGLTQEVPTSLFKAKRTGQERDGLPRSKRPDLAILHTSSSGRASFTAIEVERVMSRPIRDYREKLLTYTEDPHVDAIWYLCDRAPIRNRVRQAYTDLLKAGEIADTSTTPTLVETVQHWGEPPPREQQDGYLRRTTSWVGLPGIGLDGSPLLNSKGEPSAVGKRMLGALRMEQNMQSASMRFDGRVH